MIKGVDTIITFIVILSVSKLIISQKLSFGSPPSCTAPQCTYSLNFSINAGPFQTSRYSSFYYIRNSSSWVTVSGTYENSKVTFNASDWIFEYTFTEDSDGIHVVTKATNNMNTAGSIPQHGFGPLSGNWFNRSESFAWSYSLADPLILADKISDNTYVGLTMDDHTFAMVVQLQKTENPYQGNCRIDFMPNGGPFDQQYQLGVIPVVVQPKSSVSFPWSLRFGSTYQSVSQKTYNLWATTYPYSLNWPDRRLMMRGDVFYQDPTTTNPQGYSQGYDINSPTNFAKFAKDILQYADDMITRCKALDVSAWIEWQIDGNSDLAFKYTGNPQLIEQNAGWAQIINGTTLFRLFVKRFTDAKIHFGITIRPWTLIRNSTGLYKDPTKDDFTSIEAHIDFAYKTFGIDVFYYDSPLFRQTYQFRKIAQKFPKVLVIPEYAPESWLQFCAPMVWDGVNVINWVSVPRNIYGSTGWAVYFHQGQTPGYPDRLLADALLGSTLIEDNGWFGPIEDIRNRTLPIATADYASSPAGKFAASGAINGNHVKLSVFVLVVITCYLFML